MSDFLKYLPWTGRPTTTKTQTAVKSVVLFVVFAVIVYGIVFAIGKAEGVSSPKVISPEISLVTCVSPCPSPKKFAVTKYKEGKMGHHAFTPRTLFTNPRAVRRMLIGKIRYKLNHASPNVIVSGGGTSHSARWYYRQMLANDRCIGHNSYAPYSYGYNVCNITGSKAGNTKRAIQGIGALVFCGGGVFAQLIADGGTSIPVFFAAGGCGWGAWMALNP